MGSQEPSDGDLPTDPPRHRTQERTNPTGVPNLDLVLGGGLPGGALAIIVGAPGTGKTTLASQIAFHTARAGRNAVVVTAISEPSTKLIAHLRSFTFYEDHLVGRTIQFMSLEQFLPSGLHVSGEELVAIARQTRAELVVLDGFRGVRGADVDPQAARLFLYDVGTALSTLGATTIITSEADPLDPAFFPEATTADIIIGLYAQRADGMQQRAVEILKIRGGAPLPGVHAFAVSAAGVRIYPRLEARIAAPDEVLNPDGWDMSADETSDAAAIETDEAEPAPSAHSDTARPRATTRERTAGPTAAEPAPAAGEGANILPEEGISFGLPKLDALLAGGAQRGTSTLVVGSLGAGKTFLGLHFALEGVCEQTPTLYLSFRETRAQLLRKVRDFTLGAELRTALAPGGLLTLHHWDPIELSPDIVADRLLVALDRTHAQRLVIDSIAELEHAVVRTSDVQRLRDYLAALLVALQQRGVTALCIREHATTVATSLDLVAGPASVLAENVLLLQHIEAHAKLHRVLSVVKTRYSGHDPVLYEFTISAPQGLDVIGPYLSDGAIIAAVSKQAEAEQQLESATDLSFGHAPPEHAGPDD
jgi:circadian clock protein KaiC